LAPLKRPISRAEAYALSLEPSMLYSWRDWQLRGIRWIAAAVFAVAGLAALALGAGIWSIVIAGAAQLLVVVPLEVRARRKQPDALSS
jgi:hypothetical protein